MTNNTEHGKQGSNARLPLDSYRLLRRLWLAELRAARLAYRAHAVTFGCYYGKVKTAVAVRHVAGLGYFPVSP